MRRRVEIALSLFWSLPFTLCRRKTLIKYKTCVPTAVVWEVFFLILFLTTSIERPLLMGGDMPAVAGLCSRPTRWSQSNSHRSTVFHIQTILLTWCTQSVRNTDGLQTNRTTGIRLSMTRGGQCEQSSLVLISRWQTDDRNTGHGVGDRIDFSAGFTGDALHRGHRIFMYFGSLKLLACYKKSL